MGGGGSGAQCNNVVFDDVHGRIICADDGTVLHENMIDDDFIDFDRVYLPPQIYIKLRKFPYLMNNL